MSSRRDHGDQPRTSTSALGQQEARQPKLEDSDDVANSGRMKRATALKASEIISRMMAKRTKKERRRSEEYEVDEILSHTEKNGKTIYNISWVGYPGYISEMTEEDLVNCRELLQEYKLKMENHRGKRVNIS